MAFSLTGCRVIQRIGGDMSVLFSRGFAAVLSGFACGGGIHCIMLVVY